MKLNRLFSLILCIMLAFSTALAEMPANTEEIKAEGVELVGDTESTLSGSEILSWVERVLQQSESENEAEKPVEEELGFAVKKESCTLYYDSSDIANAHLLAIRITEPLIEGPRGEMIYDEQNQLLKLYPNDNPDLVGDRDFAVLYLSAEMPEHASYGIVSRDGQKIRTVEYYVFEKRPNDMYSSLVLSFSIENNSIESISVYGIMDEISQEDVQEDIRNASTKLNSNSYFAYKTSSNGEELSPFEREDFILGGVDLLSITADKLIEIIGSPDTDEEREIDEKRYRLLTWDGINISFAVNEKGERLSRLTINDNVMEGPRGTIVGDTFASVVSRFRSEGNPVDEDNQEMLYGEEYGESYGVANYYPNGMELAYYLTIKLDKDNKLNALADFNFEGNLLSEINIIFQE